MSTEQAETEIERLQGKETPGDGYVEFRHDFYDKFTDRDIEFKFRFKRPTQPQIERMQKTMQRKPNQAFTNLLIDIVHQDNRQEMMRAFNTYPGLAGSFGNAVLTSVGFGEVGN